MGSCHASGPTLSTACPGAFSLGSSAGTVGVNEWLGGNTILGGTFNCILPTRDRRQARRLRRPAARLTGLDRDPHGQEFCFGAINEVLRFVAPTLSDVVRK